jgi:hypothetical protein
MSGFLVRFPSEISLQSAFPAFHSHRWRVLFGLVRWVQERRKRARGAESIPLGTNRRSHYKTLKKLWRWAFELGYVEFDPMVRLKPLDAWGINNEILSLKQFQRFLRVAKGLEAPRVGLQRVTKYRRLVPYLVLGGLQGLRTCEMVREDGNDPVLEWRDFLWKKKLVAGTRGWTSLV